MVLAGCKVVVDPKIEDDGGEANNFYQINLDSGIYGVVLSADGSLMAVNGYVVGGISRVVDIYNTKTKVKLFHYINDSIIRAINFSDDGTKLLLVSEDSNKDALGTVIDTKTGATIRVFNKCYQVSMLRDGSAIVADTNRVNEAIICLYSISSGQLIKKLSFDYKVLAVFVGVNSLNNLFIRYLGGLNNDTHLLNWDLTNDVTASDIVVPDVDWNVWKFGLSPDMLLIGSANYDKSKFNFYSTQTGIQLNTNPFVYPYEKNQSTSHLLSIGNDSTFVVQGYENNSILPPTIYKIADGEIVKKLNMPSQRTVYKTFTYSSNSQVLAGVEQNNNSISIWKIK